MRLFHTSDWHLGQRAGAAHCIDLRKPSSILVEEQAALAAALAKIAGNDILPACTPVGVLAEQGHVAATVKFVERSKATCPVVKEQVIKRMGYVQSLTNYQFCLLQGSTSSLSRKGCFAISVICLEMRLYAVNKLEEHSMVLKLRENMSNGANTKPNR